MISSALFLYTLSVYRYTCIGFERVSSPHICGKASVRASERETGAPRLKHLPGWRYIYHQREDIGRARRRVNSHSLFLSLSLALACWSILQRGAVRARAMNESRAPKQTRLVRLYFQGQSPRSRASGIIYEVKSFRGAFSGIYIYIGKV